MGVDIYGYAEVLHAGCWEFIGQMLSNPEYGYDCGEPEMMPEELFHSGRRELAAILTDSGNPIRSTRPYTPVAPRRGLPSDLSAELAGWLQRNEGAPWFVPTWFTVREVLEFGWEERIMQRRAMVPAQAGALFANCPRGFPLVDWPVGVPVKYAEWTRDGVVVEWLESYAEIASEFVRDVLPRLDELGPRDQVRLIVVASW